MSIPINPSTLRCSPYKDKDVVQFFIIDDAVEDETGELRTRLHYLGGPCMYMKEGFQFLLPAPSFTLSVHQARALYYRIGEALAKKERDDARKEK